MTDDDFDSCDYCETAMKTGETCGVQWSSSFCTREPGHSGPHVACSILHAVSIWTTHEPDPNQGVLPL
jgi:hypothetical protein